MHCKKCGREIENNEDYCDECSKKPKKIKVTYEDKVVEVDAPVIIESHTFVDDNGKLQDEIKKHDKSIKKENKRNKKQEKKALPNEVKKTLLILSILAIITSFATVYIVKMRQEKISEIKVDVRSVWEDASITIDEINYDLNDNYSKFQKNGWIIDEDTVRRDYVIVSANKKTQESINIMNEKYHKSLITIGLENTSEYAKELTECNVYSVELNNYQQEDIIPFILPGDLKYGSTEETIFKKYGTITNKNDIKEDIKGYTVYKFSANNKILELYVTKEKGLQGFKLKNIKNV